jgi:hypothetical protein
MVFPYRLLLFMSCLLIGADQLVAAKHDSRFYQDYSQKITFKPYFSRYFMTFNYLLPNNQVKESYEPNNTYDLGLSISHKWFAIWYSYGVLNANDTKLFGKSRYFDIQGDAFLGNKSILTVLYQKYSGFYAQKNPSLTPSFFDSLPGVVRSDLKISNIGLQYLYVFGGNKLSFRASYSQTQVQTKSKGSFLFGAGLTYFNVAADSSIVNRSYSTNDTFADEYKYKEGNFITPAIRGGYVFNLVLLKSFSVLASAVPGISYGVSNYTLEKGNQKREEYGFNFQVQFRYGVQFNTRHFFIGLDGTTDVYSKQLQQGRFLFIPTRAELFLGFRLKAPKFLCPKCK